MTNKGSGQHRIVFTICAANYMAQANILAKSLKYFNPNIEFVVFFIGAETAETKYLFYHEIIPASQALEPREWNHRLAHYNILEFATSIKPACFRFLFDRGADEVIYFDPDIQVFSSLDFIFDASDSIALTPHILSPLPDDGKIPSDLTILKAGLYNLGFAFMRNTPAAQAMLAWWDAHLRTLCLEDTKEGVFTDQKWMEFAPIFADSVHIIRHPGCNVAYWNLHERTPLQSPAGWQVRCRDADLHDLVFFHFSGFSPDNPQLSKHENRFGTEPPGGAPTLLEDYRDALIEAGYDTISRIRVPSPRFAGGAAWDPVCRALYRRAVRSNLDLGDPLDGDAFLAWAAGSDDGDHVVRYLRTLMTLRGDVAVAFDEGRDTAGLAAWLRGSGHRELGIDPALLDLIVGAASRAGGSVNYVGYFRAHLGVAEAARNSVEALTRAGVGVTAIDITDGAASPVGAYALSAAASGSAAPAISIIGCNADMLPSVLSRLPARIQNTYRIGCWYWEAPEFPDEWCDRFDMVDEIWAATRFIAEAVRAKATVPVVVIPVMVAPPKVARDRAWLAALAPEITPDEFVFLFQFDVRSVPFRKNPEGAIAAFTRAFTPDEPVRLVIKMLNAGVDPGLVARLRGLAGGNRVSFMGQTLESTDRFRLLASVDSFVSLHRAEGLGLSIAEAMAYGLPVVATDWSGNVDFTSAENAALVGYDLMPTTAPHGPYPEGTVWAEPRIAEAAGQMRRIVDDPAWRAAIGSAAARSIATELSAATVGATMRTRLERLTTSARVSRMTRSLWVGGAALLPASAASGDRPARRGALATVAGDMMAYPVYYASRLPRVPRLIYANGLQGFFARVATVARDNHDIKRTTRLSFAADRGTIPDSRTRSTGGFLRRIFGRFFRFSA